MKKTRLGAAVLAAYALFLGVMLHRQGETFAERAAARARALSATHVSASAVSVVSPAG